MPVERARAERAAAVSLARSVCGPIILWEERAMTPIRVLMTLLAALAAATPAAAQPTAARPVAHEELGRAIEDLMGEVQGLGARWREHFAPAGAVGGRAPRSI